MSFGIRQPVSFGFASAQFRNCQSSTSSFPLVEEHAAPLRAPQAKPARLHDLQRSILPCLSIPCLSKCVAHMAFQSPLRPKRGLPPSTFPVVSPCFGAWNSAHVHPRLLLRPPHLV